MRDLPHELVAAFRSTLQEAREATLLLHVIDAADPHRCERIAQVNRCSRVGAGSLPQIEVFNKTDRIDALPRLERAPDGRLARVWLAAARDTGLELVRAALTSALWPELERATLQVDLQAAAVRSQLYADHRVRAERVREDGGWEMEVEVTRRQLEALARGSGRQPWPAEHFLCARRGIPTIPRPQSGRGSLIFRHLIFIYGVE